MSIRRTRDQKITAQLQRQEEGYHYTFSAKGEGRPSKNATSKTESVSRRPVTASSLLGFPVEFVFQDLRRTAVVTSVVVALLLLIVVQEGFVIQLLPFGL